MFILKDLENFIRIKSNKMGSTKQNTPPIKLKITYPQQKYDSIDSHPFPLVQMVIQPSLIIHTNVCSLLFTNSCIHLRLTLSQPTCPHNDCLLMQSFTAFFTEQEALLALLKFGFFFFSNDMFQLRSGSETQIDKGYMKIVRMVFSNTFSVIFILEFIFRIFKKILFLSLLCTIIFAQFR